MWNACSGALVSEQTEVHNEINSICCSGDSYYLFTSDNHGDVKQWWIKSDGLEKTGDQPKLHANAITSMVVSDDNKFLFTCDIEGLVCQWNVEGLKLVKEFPDKGFGNTLSLSLADYSAEFFRRIAVLRNVGLTSTV